jgi:cytochrome c oxidase subunit 4
MSTETHNHAANGHQDEVVHAHDHTKWYVGTICALFVLTAITVYAANFHFGSNFINLMIAMAIATVKASLVAAFFMHLFWERGLNALIFVSTIFFVAVFMSFTFLDVESREHLEAATPAEGVAAGIEPAPIPLYVVQPPANGSHGAEEAKPEAAH